MKLTVKKTKIIEEGKHEGVIIGVKYRTEPYQYTDIIIEFDEGMKVTYGIPTNLTPDSKLGELLILFGAVVEVETEIDPEEILINKECTFIIMKEEGNKFVKIVPKSLKPK